MNIPGVKALVPMKHHSERVPGKNHRPFCGRPLFVWVLDTLRSSRHVEEIIINTDSEEIARTAESEFGVTILWRPEHLLGDMIGIQPLIAYDLDHSDGDLYLQTHSTNPLLSPETVDQAIEAFFASGAHDSLFTVTPVQSRFYWSDGRPINHDPDHLVRTQDLPVIYEENSCIYIFSRSMFERRGHRLGDCPLMFPIDPLEAIDIDEEHDFQVAESIMHARLAAGAD